MKLYSGYPGDDSYSQTDSTDPTLCLILEPGCCLMSSLRSQRLINQLSGVSLSRSAVRLSPAQSPGWNVGTKRFCKPPIPDGESGHLQLGLWQPKQVILSLNIIQNQVAFVPKFNQSTSTALSQDKIWNWTDGNAKRCVSVSVVCNIANIYCGDLIDFLNVWACFNSDDVVFFMVLKGSSDLFVFSIWAGLPLLSF